MASPTTAQTPKETAFSAANRRKRRWRIAANASLLIGAILMSPHAPVGAFPIGALIVTVAAGVLSWSIRGEAGGSPNAGGVA